jgi:hypothetical protein
MPIASNETRAFTVAVEFVRNGSSLRGKIRARLEPSQLRINLSADPDGQTE